MHVDVGFNNYPAADIYQMDPEVLKGFEARYEPMKKFQKITSSLFKASLEGEMDPEIARLIINELPACNGFEHHRGLYQNAKQMFTPAFFRTDETVPGKISEIQPPGSAWCIFEQLYLFYKEFSQDFKGNSIFQEPLSKNFVQTLREYMPYEPIVHHMLDNASIQAGMRFFLQRTRQHGLKYFGYDKGVTAYDCNFIRAHAFQSLLSDNYFAERISSWEKGLVEYDLPPSIVFDEKIPMIFPFWEKTRSFYPDEVRDLFPYTTLVTPDGFQLEDGTYITLDGFFNLPRNEKPYFFKYAGSNLAFNWGSKGVYYAGTQSRPERDKLKARILDGFSQKKYWIIQKKHTMKENISYLDRAEDIKKTQATAKYSGFYGPNGLMGILIMHREFIKVHGTNQTIVSIC